MSWHVHETYEYSPAAALSRTRVTATNLRCANICAASPWLNTVPIRTGMSNCTIMSETIYLIELSFGYTS